MTVTVDVKINKKTRVANGPKNTADNHQAFAVKSSKVFKQTSNDSYCTMDKEQLVFE